MAEATIGIDGEAKRQIAALVNVTNQLQGTISRVESDVKQVNSNLSSLRSEFEVFRKDQARSSAINQATTELVRVRQELAQRFSNYSVVRETMLGVLQATDLALVKKETISRVSEELMLSTPDYWLAPCLVAVAAWIGNDKDLAERAIREAVRRDEAKTALTMALICRRNERQTTCYEWLSVYFSHQDSGHFSESTLMYIDAYVNGIFGNDEKHICSDYISKWMNEVKANSANIELNQDQIWKDYCSGFSYEVAGQFPDLKTNVEEYDRIDGYIRRINSVEPITTKFNDIQSVKIDPESLKQKIDKRLLQLIGRYDVKEAKLKDEEHYYDLVKKFNGDEQKARDMITREKKQSREKTLNLVEQMTNVIVSPADTTPSMKKTAVSFLSGFINHGFGSYIKEKKEEFPDTITIQMEGWKAQTQDGNDVSRIVADYEREMNTRRQWDITKATVSKPMAMYILGGLAAIVGIVLMFIQPVVGIMALVAGAALAIYGFVCKKNMDKKITEINQFYDYKIGDGINRIQRICDQWRSAKVIVADFEGRKIDSVVA